MRPSALVMASKCALALLVSVLVCGLAAPPPAMAKRKKKKPSAKAPPPVEAAKADKPTGPEKPGLGMERFVAGNAKVKDRHVKRVEKVVVKVLEDAGFRLIGHDDLDKMAGKLPRRWSAYGKKNRVMVAAHLQLKAFVVGAVMREGRGRKRRWKLYVKLRNGADGEDVAEFTIEDRRLRRLTKKVKREFMKRAKPALARTAAPPVPEPRLTLDGPSAVPATAKKVIDYKRAPAEAPPAMPPPTAVDETLEPEQPSPSEDDTSPLDIALFGGFIYRDLGYDPDPGASLRGHTLPAAVVTLALDWFPGAHATDGAGAHVGITGRFDYTMSFETEGPGGPFPTQHFRVNAGIKGRIPFGLSSLTIAGLYGHEELAIDDNGGTSKPPVPSVAYDWAGLEIGGRIHLAGPAFLLVDAAYRYVFGAGEILESGYLGGATIHGVSAHLGVSIDVYDGLEVRLLGELARYFYSPDASGVDSAHDMVVGGTLGLAYHL